MGKRQKTNNDYYSEIAQFIIEKLEDGTVPWVRTWQSFSDGLLRNPVTGTEYRGINRLLLGLACPYDNPFFFTFNNVKKLGGKVKKGSKSFPVYFMSKIKTKEVIGEVELPCGKTEEQRKEIFVIKSYRVFNAEQCDGLPKEYYPIPQTEDEKKGQYEINPTAEAIIHDYLNNATIKLENGSPAYSPSCDTIYMPRQSKFDSYDSYISTMFHEMAHSTGAAHRLDRLNTANAARYSKAYGLEELVAEMSSAQLCGLIGANSQIDNSAAYINGWMQSIREEPRIVWQAATRAERATNYILDTSSQ